MEHDSDLNVIIFPYERFGGCLMDVGMVFSDWINSHSMMEIHMSGVSMTF